MVLAERVTMVLGAGGWPSAFGCGTVSQWSRFHCPESPREPGSGWTRTLPEKAHSTSVNVLASLPNRGRVG
jgi:hypothetical protein